MKRWVRSVRRGWPPAGRAVGLFGMLRRQTEDRKGAESYAEAAAIAGAELPAAESAAQTPAEEQETQDPYLQMFARMDVEALRQVNPKDDDAHKAIRRGAVQASFRSCTQVPLTMMEICAEAIDL